MMKNLLFYFTALILLLFSCTKTNTDNFCANLTNNFPVNPGDLITDTTGTNDTGNIFVPSAFTPNNDGLNDIFYPMCKNISLIQSMIIFNHTGDTIFHLSNINPTDVHASWDGKPATTTSAYYYKIQATTMQGNHIGTYGKVYLLTCIPACLKIDTLKFSSQFDGSGFNLNLASNEMLPSCN